MAYSKYLEFQDADANGLLDKCDELASVPQDLTCPPCKKNPSYSPPDWKTKDEDEPWLNEKICKYQITVVTNEKTLIPSSDATEQESLDFINKLFNDHKETAIDGILSYYDKNNVQSVIESLKPIVEKTEFDLDYRPNSKVKLLFSIPFEEIAIIDDIVDDNTEESEEDDPDDPGSSAITVSYSPNDFHQNILKVRKTLFLYNKYYMLYRQMGQGNLYYESGPHANSIFNFSRYGDNGITGTGTLEKIAKDIDKFLSGKGFRLRGGSFSKFGTDPITELTLEFTKEYLLKRIRVKAVNCGEKEFIFSKRKIKTLTKKGHFKDKTAMAYISKAEDMATALQAREPGGWVDFVTTYTYPQIRDTFNWPIDNPIEQETSHSCLGESIIETGANLGVDIIDIDISLYDAMMMVFNKSACKTDLPALRQEQIEIGKVFDPLNPDRAKATLMAAARQQAFQQLDADGAIFLSFCDSVFSRGDEQSTSPGSEDTQTKFAQLMNRLKLCGLKDFMIDGVKCLFNNLSLEDALSSVVGAALRNMSLENFGKLFVALPAQDQQRLQQAITDRIESGNIFRNDSNNERLNAYMEEGVGPADVVNNTAPFFNRDRIQTARQAAEQSWSNLRNRPEDGVGNTLVNNNSGTLVQNYQASTNQTVDNGATAFVMELYVQAMLEHFSDDLLSIVEILNRFPGAQLIAKSLLLLDCPQPRLFEPSMLDFIRNIELPFCRGADDIRLPVMRNPFEWIPKINDIFGALHDGLRLAVQASIVNVFDRLLVNLCNLLGQIVCNSLAAVGTTIGNTLDPNNRTRFQDTIREAICGDNSTDENIQATLLEMFEKLGLGAAALANTDALLEFTGDISASLTADEFTSLYLGEPSEESLRVLDQLAEDHSRFRDALPSKEAIRSFFKDIGNTLPPEYRDSLRNFRDSLPPEDYLPMNPTLCATPEAVANFCDYRSRLLSDRTSPATRKILCDNYYGGLKDKLDDLSNALQQNPADIVADAILPLYQDCTDTPEEPELVTESKTMTIGSTLKQLHIDFSNDMLGNGPGEKNWGLMNLILSDTLGVPLTAHYRRSFNRNNYIDFVTSDVEDDAGGQFPAYVAEWLQQKLGELSETVSFNCNNDFSEKTIKSKTFDEFNIPSYSLVKTINLPDLGYRTIPVVDYEQQQINYIRHGRKENPDLKLSFRDNNKGKVFWDNSSYLYGFDIDLFLSDMVESTNDDGTKSAVNFLSDNARVNITSLLNFNADISRADEKSMTADEKDAYKSAKNKDASIQKERLYEFFVTDTTLDKIQIDLSQYPNFMSCFKTTKDYAPQLVLFREILQQNGFNLPMETLKSQYDSFLNNIFSALTSEVASNQQAFLYGAQYDSLSEAAAEYVVQEGQTDSPAGTLYSDATINGESLTNEDMIFGISRDQYENGDNARVFYLDPNTFGGSYVNPPLYVKPLKNEGWLGIVDVLFPELSPCKPSRTDLVDFGEINSQIDDNYRKIPSDERLQYDKDCVIEKPFHRILNNYSAAVIQGLITSAARIYSTVHFVKTLATFTTFKPDFENMYSNIYAQYIVEAMETSFKDAQGAGWEAFNTFKDEEFWYAFLEQAVQAYSRQVDDGTIPDPPRHVIDACLRCNDLQKRTTNLSKEEWKKTQDLAGDLSKAFAAATIAGRPAALIPGVGIPGALAAGATAGAITFAANYETYKEYSERIKFDVLRKSEESAKIVLQEMVKKELQHMSDKFIENLKTLDLQPKYHDIGYYVMTNLSQGGIDLDLHKEIVEVQNEEPSEPSSGITTNVANHYHTYSVDEEGNGWAYEAYHPTQPKIYHKHQIINWEVQEAHSNCYPNCKDIYDLEGIGAHIHYINDTIVEIGDIQPFGFEFDTESALPFIVEKYISINDVKYSPSDAVSIVTDNESGLNISDVYPGSLELIFEPSSVVIDPDTGLEDYLEPTPVGIKGQIGVRHGLQFSCLINGTKYELASVEIDALDYEVKAFAAVEANSKELLCLIKMLKNDSVFKLATQYIMPISKFLSTIAIYNDLAFLPSIGEVTVDTGKYNSSYDEKPGIKIKSFDESGTPEYEYKEGWASADDRIPGLFSGWFVREWDYWDQELLRNSKSQIKRMFKTNYYNRDFESRMRSMFDFDPAQHALNELKAKLKPRLGTNILPRWRRSKLRDNPFDSEGKLCDK